MLFATALLLAAPVQDPKPEEPPPAETVVSAERPPVEPTPIERIGSREILDTHEIERIAPTSPNALVQWLPGVSSRPYNGGDAIAPNFAIRGLPDDGLTEYILTTIDGVPANPMPYGWTAMSYLPVLPDMIAGAEILKGGFAVRFSPNTVGGVLNLVTPPVPERLQASARGTYGSFNTHSELFSVGQTQGDWGYLLTLGAISGDGYRDEGEWSAAEADLKLRHDLGQGRWLSTRISWFVERHQRPGGLTVAQYDQDPYQNTRPTNYQSGHREVVDATLHEDEGSGFSEWYGWISSTYNKIDGPTPYSDSATTHRTNTYEQYDANLGWRRETDANWAGLEQRIQYGARASYEWLPERKFVDTPLAGGPSAVTLDTRYELFALSAHVDDTFEPVKDLSVTAGLRAEWVPNTEGHNSVTDESFSDQFFTLLPAIGANWKASEDVAFFASYQKSFRAPQVFGFGTAAGTADDNQDLDFEHGQSVEAGVRWRPTEGVSTSATLWRTDFDNVGITVNSVYQTIGRVVADGVDLDLEFEGEALAEALRGWRSGVSATFQDSELRDAVDPANDGHQTPFAWEQKLTGYLEYETPTHWIGDVDATYMGTSYADEANTEAENAAGTVGLNPSHTSWGAGLRRAFELGGKGRLQAGLRVDNLFDQEWFLHSRLGGKIVGAPQMVTLSLGLSF